MGAFKNLLKGYIIIAFNFFDVVLVYSVNVLLGTETGVGGGLGVLPGAWGFVESIHSALIPFCMVIIGICLLIEIAQISAKVDVMRWEQGLKICVKMVLARVMLDLAPTVLRAIYLQSTHWVSAASGIGSGSSLGLTLVNELIPLVDSMGGFFEILGLYLSIGVVVIGIEICAVVIIVVSYGRLFEIYAHLAVAPLPCAFFPLSSGGDGTGFSRVTGKFFKSFAAVCLQAVMMVVCLRIFGHIMEAAVMHMAAMGAATGSIRVGELCFLMLMGSIVLVMSVIKSGSWAKSILDVI